MKVLVVGAGGFIGGFIVSEGLNRGHEVWAGIRTSTSRRWLPVKDPKFHELVLDYDSPAALASAFDGAPRFDWVVFNLGATKAVNFSDFNRVNFDYMRRVAEALSAAGKMPDKFLYMSSLSAVGPGDEKGFTPLSTDDMPHPNTRYGLSKIKSESWLQAHPDIPWIIFRPTGVYGPHEKDYLMMVKAIDRGFDFGVGFKRQMLTFIYVDDLVAAIYDALQRAPIHHTYIISEPRAYSQAEFRTIVQQALGRKLVIPVRLPLWGAKVVSAIAGKIGQAQMKPSTLNPDKYKIMKQRNWACDVTPAVRDFGFMPKIDLHEGIARVVDAYRAEKSAKKGGRQ